MEYVVIGNSYAALGAINGIRSIDKASPIYIISKEPYYAYARPVISYVLYSKAKEENIFLRPEEYYKENNVIVKTSCEALSIDSDNHSIKLSDETNMHFDKLLIATGSSPFIPPMKGLEKVKDKFTFMTLDDMKSVEKAVNKKKSVLIIGAGLIGLKAAEGVLDRSKEVNVVDLAPRILPSILDEEASKLVQKELEEKGIKFHLGCSAEEFNEKSVKLTNKEELSFDVLILAVGVRPNTSLAKAAGLACSRGIVVNDMCRTSNPDIYAAGDVAEEVELTTGENRIIAIIPNATMQGETAGVNMAGGDKHFTNPVAMNAIGFFGSHIITAGTYNGDCEVIKDETFYKKFFIKDNKLKGFILMGRAVDRAGIYTAVVRNQLDLSTIDWNTLKEKPSLAAFALKERKNMLTKEV